jgi:glutamate synthase domain-containing protein 2
MRRVFIVASFVILAVVGVIIYFWPPAALLYLVLGPLVALGVVDMTQTKHAIRRNFPIVGHGRYLLELIRPEINQYFVESNTDGMPFSREVRSLVYQRAKGELDTIPFGTQRDVYEDGYEWLNHSIVPKVVPAEEPRILIGETTCEQPYAASILNVSAMSFGALSDKAIMALNKGASIGGFAHNTGEGGLSPHHRKHGGDLIWQIGTGYFGCRTPDGKFDRAAFAETATDDQVKMIEVKISQGAKPGHGGILPAAKLTPEIAAIRGVPLGFDVNSPPAHTAFCTPVELLEFLTELRELSGGKPVGFKLCIGKRREFLAICKAMVETNLHPDFIVIDGAEGGTGAAPLEFSNRLGCPLTEALTFAHNALVGIGMRRQLKIFASGKIVSGFDVAKMLAVGADACYSARAMMMAVGCIQARRCNNNDCPAGVATQDPALTIGLVVDQKAERAARFHRGTVHSFLELIAAAGLVHPDDLRPWHIFRRTKSTEITHYGQLIEFIEPGSLLTDTPPNSFARAWRHAHAATFEHVDPIKGLEGGGNTGGPQHVGPAFSVA